MAYLLDTCAVSECQHKMPNPGVLDFLAGLRSPETFISVVTIGEIVKGIGLLPQSRRRTELELWYGNDLLYQFERRILAIDATVAEQCGALQARLIGAGQKMAAMDALIAATARTYDLTLVTRNVDDFAHAGIRIENPWA